MLQTVIVRFSETQESGQSKGEERDNYLSKPVMSVSRWVTRFRLPGWIECQRGGIPFAVCTMYNLDIFRP